MRLDKFLQVSGLIKRRVLGNEACTRGLVCINGNRAKPTRDVKAGDIIDLHLPYRDISVRVLQELTNGSMKKSDRPKYLEILRDEARKPPQEDSWWEVDLGDPPHGEPP